MNFVIREVVPVVCAMTMFICGCGKEPVAVDAVSSGSEIFISEFPDSEVFARVGQVELKQSDIRNNISMAIKLAACRSGRDLTVKQRESIAGKVKSSILKQFLNRELVHVAISTNAPAFSEAELEKKKGDFFRQFIRNGQSVGEVLSRLSRDELAIVEHTVRSQVELEAYFSQKCADRIKVTDEQIDAAMKRTREWNQMVEATNAWAYATASNIIRRVEAGEDFGALADRYSQDPDKKPGGLINEPAAVYFSNGRTSYLDMLEQMPDGRVTDILECTEGIMVVKVLAKSDRTKMHDYQRIVLQTGVKYPDYTRKQLYDIGIAELQQEIYDELISAAKKAVSWDYTHGEDYFKSNKQETR